MIMRILILFTWFQVVLSFTCYGTYWVTDEGITYQRTWSIEINTCGKYQNYEFGYPQNCLSCSGGHYCPGNGLRYPCGTCSTPGNYVSIQCDICRDVTCSPCTSGMFCPGDTYQYNCSICPNGKLYSKPCNSSSDTRCDSCPNGTYVPADRVGSSYSDCLCLPGTYGSYETGCKVCTECVNGYVLQSCTSTTDTVCMICPENATAIANATSYLECFCKPGFYGIVTNPSSSTCAPCPVDMYCPSVSTKQCPCL